MTLYIPIYIYQCITHNLERESRLAHGSHRGGQVTALVSVRPTQAAHDVEHLELELHSGERERGERRECHKWLPCVLERHILQNEDVQIYKSEEKAEKGTLQ